MKKINGFTLIELLIYISLMSIFLSGAIRFSWDVIYSREKAFTNRIVEQNASSALARIALEIRQAKQIDSLTTTQLVLSKTGPSTTISLNGDTLQISPDGTGPYNLTSNQVRVTNLIFTNLSSPDNNSKNINVNLTIEQLSTNANQSFVASSTLNETIELNTSFNQARNLLIDFTNLAISPNAKDVQNITLENTGDTNLIIDKVYLSWSNTNGGENITNFQINGGAEEWIGTSGTNSTLDIADYTIPAESLVTLDYLSFDSIMNDAALDLHFILTDGSIHKTYFTLPSRQIGPNPTPSPTPSPSPTITCATYCTNLTTYSSGICRKNPPECNKQGEIHQSGGDVFCTNGAQADTCCCKI